MGKVIEWGGYKFNADAEKCYHELEKLGKITPETIVEYARQEDTELHKCFQWDDAVAADNWRKQQARFIACSLKVTVDKTAEGGQSYRLIQHDEGRQEYKPIVFTVRNMDEYGRLLQQAKNEMRSFQNRYKSIAELAEVISEIEKVLSE